jgi:hypothetical protein
MLVALVASGFAPALDNFRVFGKSETIRKQTPATS